MGENAKQGEHEREAVDNAEEHLDANNHVYEPGEQSFCENGVFFDQFGEVV